MKIIEFYAEFDMLSKEITDFLFKHRKLLALGILDKESDDILLKELDPGAKSNLIALRTVLQNHIEDALMKTQKPGNYEQIWSDYANSNDNKDKAYENFVSLLNAVSDDNLNKIMTDQIKNLESRLDLEKTTSRMFDILKSKINDLNEKLIEKTAQLHSLKQDKKNIEERKSGQKEENLGDISPPQLFSVAQKAYHDSPHTKVENNFEEILKKLQNDIENIPQQNQSNLQKKIYANIIEFKLPQNKFKIYDELVAVKIPKPSALKRFVSKLTKPFATALHKFGIGNGQGSFEQQINNYEIIAKARDEMTSIPQFQEVKQKFEAMHKSRDNMLASSDLQDLEKSISQCEKEISALEKSKSEVEQIYLEKSNEDKEENFYREHSKTHSL